LVCYVVFFSRLLVSRFIFHIPIMQIPFALLFPYTTLFRSHPVDGLLTRLSLLMPAFSLETPPPLVHTATSPATRRSPTQHHTITAIRGAATTSAVYLAPLHYRRSIT